MIILIRDLQECAAAVASFYQVKSDVPRYKVDLDLPPEQRWNEIIDVYKDRVIEIERQLDKDVGVLKLLSRIVCFVDIHSLCGPFQSPPPILNRFEKESVKDWVPSLKEFSRV